MRKKYLIRFFTRVFILAGLFILYFAAPQSFEVLEGMEFFNGFSVLHIVWGVWIADMVLQLIPTKNYLLMGSQKQFFKHFRPITDRKTREELKAFITSSNYAGLKVLGIWIVLTGIIGVLFKTGILGSRDLLLITTFFYVCDLICVLFWCPFKQWFLKNRCCTTCRIFNWDHLMMFSPVAFVKGFFTWSLLLVSFIVFFTWEVCIVTHPERFWEGTNGALRCQNCNDNLCGSRNCKISLNMSDPMPPVRDKMKTSV